MLYIPGLSALAREGREETSSLPSRHMVVTNELKAEAREAAGRGSPTKGGPQQLPPTAESSEYPDTVDQGNADLLSLQASTHRLCGADGRKFTKGEALDLVYRSVLVEPAIQFTVQHDITAVLVANKGEH